MKAPTMTPNRHNGEPIIIEQLHPVRRLNTYDATPLWLMATPEGHSVAVKRLATSILSFRTRALFVQRLNLMRTLRHPRLVPVYTGQVRFPGHCSIVMAYYPRGSLFDAVSPGERRLWTLPLPPFEAVRLLEEMIEGVAVLHAQEIMHGGLKLTNILIDAGPDTLHHASITDVALHQGIGGELFNNLQSRPVGISDPLLYIAPEQYQRHPSTASDAYALGMIAFVLLTGESPYRYDPAAVLQARTPPALRHASEVNPVLPVAFDEVLQRALHYTPRARYRRLSDFARALHAACDSRDTVRSLRVATGTIPGETAKLQRLTREDMAHEELSIPAPLAIVGADDNSTHPGIPALPSNYHWTPEVLSMLPPPEVLLPVRPAKRTISSHPATMALYITTGLVIAVLIIVLTLVAANAFTH